MSPERQTVRVTRAFEASAERVFDAWLDPAMAGRFLFATDAGEMVRAEIDARVGGRFTFVDRRDGVDVEHVGEYVEIDRPRRLVFDFAVPSYSPDRTRVSIDIVPRGDEACQLSLVQDSVPADNAERSGHGWTKILDALDRAIRQASA